MKTPEAGDWIAYKCGELTEYGEVAEPEPVPYIVKLTSGIYIKVEGIIEVRPGPLSGQEMGVLLQNYNGHRVLDGGTPYSDETIKALLGFAHYVVKHGLGVLR